MKEGLRKISMEDYRGQGADFVKFNQPKGDKFMGVADIRADIDIVGKRARIPGGKDAIPKGKYYGLKSYNGSWIIDVDDLNLSNDVKGGLKKGQNYEKEFSGRISKVVASGLRDIVLREKLTNSGNLDFPFIYAGGNFWAMGKGLGLVSSDLSPTTITAAAIISVGSSVALNSTIRVIAKICDEQGINDSDISLARMFPTRQEPFVKKDGLVNLFAPVLPVERLVAGAVYLASNKNRLVGLA